MEFEKGDIALAYYDGEKFRETILTEEQHKLVQIMLSGIFNEENKLNITKEEITIKG